MRGVILSIVPAIAFMALPAVAQVSSSETTTTTTAVAPVVGETVTKKVYKSETAVPGGDAVVEHRAERKVTTDGLGNTATESHSERRVDNGDGTQSERSVSTTSETHPN